MLVKGVTGHFLVNCPPKAWVTGQVMHDYKATSVQVTVLTDNKPLPEAMLTINIKAFKDRQTPIIK